MLNTSWLDYLYQTLSRLNRTDDVIRVAVWDQVADEGGSDIRFKLAGFARVRIDDYDLDHDTITATFLGMDPLCADM